MNSDEIRKRAKEISGFSPACIINAEIIRLAEDILGKPLEPEFDESLVKHGSVWEGCSQMFILLIPHSDDCRVIMIDNPPGRDVTHLWASRKAGLIKIISSGSYKYLGQFDFSYPQKHPLFDDAVELLKRWSQSSLGPAYETKAFLAKLGGK